MAKRDKRGEKLRRQLNRAVEKARPKDALEVLELLIEHEPTEPRWPQRLGDTLRRLGRQDDAEAAYVQAMNLFADSGFLPQAVAIGKLVVGLNPTRLDLLERIDQEAARALRADNPQAASMPVHAPTMRATSLPPRAARPAVALPPPRPGAPAAGPPPVAPPRPAPPPPPAPPPAAPAAVEPPRDHPSFIGGIPRAGLAGAAQPLEPAGDAADDEIRFSDVSDEDSITIDVSDMEVMLPSEEEEEDSLELDIAFAPPLDAQRTTQLSASALLADVSQEGMAQLAKAAELVELDGADHVCREGEQADALFVIVEGKVHVELPWHAAGGVDLAAGQVFGEACLLQGATRQADVRAKGKLVLLRIAAADLGRIVADHGDVHEVLFDLLVQRLVANTLQTSPLFASFTPEQRRGLAQLFEVRLASSGVVVQEQGKRSDGLYVLLAGELTVQGPDGSAALRLGSMLGHRSLLSHEPATDTVTASSDSIVLRLPASQFGSFAAQYPPALAHLTDLASGPLLS